MKFHERFNIEFGIEEVKRRFVNRAENRIFEEVYYRESPSQRSRIRREIAYELGIEYRSTLDFKIYIGTDFYRWLQAIEAFYRVSSYRASIGTIIESLLKDSEMDLAIRWENGRFIRSGAKLLDENLVNEPLHWLTDSKYMSVLAPYSKGLEHYLQATKRPELLSDVITDMYEALEALSKIITGRDSKDLSANAQLFLKEIKASDPYKNILKEYIPYANSFRHAVADSSKRPILSDSEVESFIYLTGIFIRLAVPRA